MNKLKEAGRDDITVVAGGIIPEDDHAELKELGIKAVFEPGTPIAKIVEFIENEV